MAESEMKISKKAGMGLTPSEIEFLHGPHKRRWEIGFVFRVVLEFIKGFRALHFVGPCVTVFGSARVTSGPYFELGIKLGAEIAHMGFAVMTGGGPGLMEAANRGAFEAGGRSIGCNIQLPLEQLPNKYLHRWVWIKYFFVRKVLLFKYSIAFIALPGGIGTMDELFEAMTLVQTKKIGDFPIVLLGKAYWEPMVQWIDFMIQSQTVNGDDRKIIFVTDDVSEALHYIQEATRARIEKQKQMTPMSWLGER